MKTLITILQGNGMNRRMVRFFGLGTLYALGLLMVVLQLRSLL